MPHLCPGIVFTPHAACKHQHRQVQRADYALTSNCQGNIAMPGGQTHLTPPTASLHLHENTGAMRYGLVSDARESSTGVLFVC